MSDAFSKCSIHAARIAAHGDAVKRNWHKEGSRMETLTKMFVKVREYQSGQTMAEYALILAAVAVVVYAGYQTMGATITTLVTTVDGKL
jgi:Flp pilus assembly pilin Flp